MYIFAFHEFVGRLCCVFFKIIYPGLHIGKNFKAWGKFYLVVYGKGTISIGDDFRCVSYSNRSGIATYSRAKITAYDGARIMIGNKVAMTGAVITSKCQIDIGDDTMLSPNVVVIDSDFHVHWPPEERFNLSPAKLDKPVKIGKNVWIGTNAIVLKGVTIGDNAIIGAGSVVTGNIPANAMAAGNPARVIKYFTEEQTSG